MSWPRCGIGGGVLLLLLGLHLALGIARLPGKVWARRLANIDEYRDKGGARFLLEDAQLGGADVIEWLLQNTPEDSVVLWRWPADGALEFAAALLAPRLLVDERDVAGWPTTHFDRPVARGTVPSGDSGLIIVQGTDDGGLRLVVR